MNKEKIIAWAKAAGIRAVKTMAQTGVAVIGTSATIGATNWVLTASTVALAGILSLLTSVGGLPEIEIQEEDVDKHIL